MAASAGVAVWLIAEPGKPPVGIDACGAAAAAATPIPTSPKRVAEIIDAHPISEPIRLPVANVREHASLDACLERFRIQNGKSG